MSGELEIWNEGVINAILQEGSTIQRKFSRSMKPRNNQNAYSFTKMIMEGNMKASMHLLSDESGAGFPPFGSNVNTMIYKYQYVNLMSNWKAFWTTHQIVSFIYPVTFLWKDIAFVGPEIDISL